MLVERTPLPSDETEPSSSRHIEDQIFIANQRRKSFRESNLYRTELHPAIREGWQPYKNEAFEQDYAGASTISERFAVFLEYIDELDSVDLAATTEPFDVLDTDATQEDLETMTDPVLFDELRDQYRELRAWLHDNLGHKELKREECGLTVHFNDQECPDTRVGLRHRPLIRFVLTNESGAPTEVTIAKRMTFLMQAADCRRVLNESGANPDNSTWGIIPEIEDLLDGERDDAQILPVSTEYYVKAKPVKE